MCIVELKRADLTQKVTNDHQLPSFGLKVGSTRLKWAQIGLQAGSTGLNQAQKDSISLRLRMGSTRLKEGSIGIQWALNRLKWALIC